MQDQGSDSSVDAVGLDKYVGKGRNGKGTLTIPDGFKYVGELKDDKFWTGILYDKNGNIDHKFGNGKPLKQYPP